MDKTVLITGASGNLGGKLRAHLAGRYDLRLLDVTAADDEIIAADLSAWDESWTQHFAGVDTVVHFAANPSASAEWSDLIAPNMDALINTFTAAAQNGVRRIVYASSNHVMGQYRDEPSPSSLTGDTPPKPGANLVRFSSGKTSVAYGSAKLFGERLGKTYADIYGLSCIAVRIGWTRRGENNAPLAEDVVDDWFRLMWLSNRDFCQLMECCIKADPQIDFVIVHGMSNNAAMRWELTETQRLVGYKPLDGTV